MKSYILKMQKHSFASDLCSGTQRRAAIVAASFFALMGWAMMCPAANAVPVPEGSPEVAVGFAVQPGSGVTTLTELAQSQGFFKTERINATMVPVNSGPAGVTALLSSSVDVTVTAPEPFMAAVSKGADLKLMMGQMTNINAIGARPGLKLPTSFPQSIRALKGLTVGVTALGSATSNLVEALVARAGLPKTAVTLVAVGNSAAQALLANHVDAAVMYGPSIAVLLNSGGSLVTDFRSAGSGCPAELDFCGADLIGMWARSDWIAKNPKVIAAIRRAIARADLWMHDPANIKEVSNIFGSQLPPSASKKQRDAFVKDQLRLTHGSYSKKSLESWLAFDYKTGVIDRAVPVDAVFATGTPQTSSELASLARN